MWRFLNSIPRAFRQHVHGPRASVGLHVEEEKTELNGHERHESLPVERESEAPNATRLAVEGKGSIHNTKFFFQGLFAKWSHERNRGYQNGRKTPGQDQEGEWWRTCQKRFWNLVSDTNRFVEAMALGSGGVLSSDEAIYKRKVRLLFRMLFAIPSQQRITNSILDVQQTVTEKSASVYKAIKDAGGAAHDADVNKAKTENLESVMVEFKSMCEEYVAQSQSILAIEAVENGNMSAAVQHLRDSCALGNSSACFNLGLCYETGSGVLQDLEKAKYYYELAAEAGHKLAVYNLALMCFSTETSTAPEASADVNKYCVERGVSLLEKAAQLGLAEAQTCLGIRLLEQQDVFKAVPYFRAAAEQNDSEAQYFLAICYEQGWGVAVNECKAGQLYAQAAHTGHDGAIYNLAVFNENGFGGMPENRNAAMDLYKKAAEMGNEQAQLRLDEINAKRAVEEWTGKVVRFQSLYIRHHSNEDQNNKKASLTLSASSPDLHENSFASFFSKIPPGGTDFIDQNFHSFYVGDDKLTTKSGTIFHLGPDTEGENDSDLSMETLKFSSDESCCASSPEEEKYFMDLHRSYTAPDFSPVAANV